MGTQRVSFSVTFLTSHLLDDIPGMPSDFAWCSGGAPSTSTTCSCVATTSTTTTTAGPTTTTAEATTTTTAGATTTTTAGATTTTTPSDRRLAATQTCVCNLHICGNEGTSLSQSQAQTQVSDWMKDAHELGSVSISMDDHTRCGTCSTTTTTTAGPTTTTTAGATTTATIGEVTTTILPSCRPVPTVSNGEFEILGGASWKLTCKSGYMVDNKGADSLGNTAPCSSSNEGKLPQCVGSEPYRCKAEEAITFDEDGNNGTTCSEDFSHAATCVANCPSGTSAVGQFQCQSGNVVGSSYCSKEGDGVTAQKQTLVAGTVKFSGSGSIEALTNSSKAAIAGGLGVSETNVKVEIKQISQGRRMSEQRLRRMLLGNLQAELRYEVLVSSIMSVGDVVEAAKNLTEKGSDVYENFAKRLDESITLEAVTTVAAPLTVVVAIPMKDGQPLQKPPTVRTVTTTTTVPATDDNDSLGAGWIVLIVIAVIIVVAVIAAFAFFCYKRKEQTESV